MVREFSNSSWKDSDSKRGYATVYSPLDPIVPEDHEMCIRSFQKFYYTTVIPLKDLLSERKNNERRASDLISLKSFPV